MEVFKSMQVDEERPPLENGDSGHEVCCALYTKSFMLSHYSCGISVRVSVHGSTNNGWYRFLIDQDILVDFHILFCQNYPATAFICIIWKAASLGTHVSRKIICKIWSSFHSL